MLASQTPEQERPVNRLDIIGNPFGNSSLGIAVRSPNIHRFPMDQHQEILAVRLNPFQFALANHPKDGLMLFSSSSWFEVSNQEEPNLRRQG